MTSQRASITMGIRFIFFNANVILIDIKVNLFLIGKCVLFTQLCPTLCNPVDYSPSGSPVPGIFQARILEAVALPFSRGSS